MRTSDFRAAARAVLAGKWIKTAVIVLLAGLLGATVGISSSSLSGFSMEYGVTPETLGVSNAEYFRLMLGALTMGLIILLYVVFLGSYVTVGLAGMGSRILDGENPRVGMLFPRGIYWKAVGMSFMRSLLISLWSLLFVIPGIVAAYSYSMADYLLYIHPEMGVMEVLRESKRRMRGHRSGLFALQLSFLGWALLAGLPGAVGVFAMNNAAVVIGALVSGAATLFVQTYMHVAFMAYFRNVDRASVWHSQARAGEEEHMHSDYDGAQEEAGESANADGSNQAHSWTDADETVAKDIFMQHGCSRINMREAGVLEDYERLNVDSSFEQMWLRDHVQNLMLRFSRDTLALDELLLLAGEYAMDDLVGRVLERIERHIRQETLPDAEILNMAGRVLALLVSGAFAENEGFVGRKKQQISDMVDRLEHRLEQSGEDGWQDALRLIRMMGRQ